MLTDRVDAALDRRLERDIANPVAVALSGGGDSLALLLMTADWARRRGRRVLAITVDHGLNPDSAAWTERAAAMAEAGTLTVLTLPELSGLAALLSGSGVAP